MNLLEKTFRKQIVGCIDEGTTFITLNERSKSFLVKIGYSSIELYLWAHGKCQIADFVQIEVVSSRKKAIKNSSYTNKRK